MQVGNGYMSFQTYFMHTEFEIESSKAFRKTVGLPFFADTQYKIGKAMTQLRKCRI